MSIAKLFAMFGKKVHYFLVLFSSAANFAVPNILMLLFPNDSVALVSSFYVTLNLAGMVGVFIFNVLRPGFPDSGRMVQVPVSWFWAGIILSCLFPGAGLFVIALMRLGIIRSPQSLHSGKWVWFVLPIGALAGMASLGLVSWVLTFAISMLLGVCVIMIGAGMTHVWLPSVSGFTLDKKKVLPLVAEVMRRYSLEILIAVMPILVVLQIRHFANNQEALVFFKVYSSLGIAGVLSALVERNGMLRLSLPTGASTVTPSVMLGSLFGAGFAFLWCFFVVKASLLVCFLALIVASSGVWGASILVHMRLSFSSKKILLSALLATFLFLISQVLCIWFARVDAAVGIGLLLINNFFVISSFYIYGADRKKIT